MIYIYYHPQYKCYTAYKRFLFFWRKQYSYDKKFFEATSIPLVYMLITLGIPEFHNIDNSYHGYTNDCIIIKNPEELKQKFPEEFI